MSFFLILAKKNSQVCQKSNLSVQRKNVKKKLLNNWFFVFFGLSQEKPVFTRKTCVFSGTFFGRVVKTTIYVSRGTLSEHLFWKEVLKTSGLSDNFWSFRDNGGKIFQGWQNKKRCPGEQPKEKFFEKRIFRFFSNSEQFSYLWRKTLPDLRNSQSTYTWKFLGKNIFWNLFNLPHLFGLWSKKRSVGKFIHELSQLQSARPEAFFDLKNFFSKKSYICSSVLEFEQFFLSFDKKKSGCQRNNLPIQKFNWRKEFVEKSFFKSSSDFQ